MQPIYNNPGCTKAIEVLYFEDAELSKTKGSETSFATFGPLSVLYLPSYHRFILQLNDWRYPILRRHPIASPDDGSYLLPTANGFFYNLTINSKSDQAIKNLDSLFKEIRARESSPDDKIVRLSALKHQESGIKEALTEKIKHAAHKIQTKVATFKTGTKGLTSTKKKVNLKDIKNKDFKKEAHSRIKKDFFLSGEKMTKEFLAKRKDNANMREERNLDALQKSLNGPIMYLPKDSIEELILFHKERTQEKSPIVDATLGKVEGKRDIIGNLREGIREVRDTLRGGTKATNLSDVEIQARMVPNFGEGISHYQG